MPLCPICLMVHCQFKWLLLTETVSCNNYLQSMTSRYERKAVIAAIQEQLLAI